MKLIQILKKHKKEFLVSGLIAVAIVVASVSLSQAEDVLPPAGADFSIDAVKQPVVVLKPNNKVALEFPIYLTNKSDAEKEVSVSLKCVKSTSTASYSQKPGKVKQIFVHPLSKEEVLLLNNLKKTKGSYTCEFSLIGSAAKRMSFDLYRNRVRLDIKNWKKK